MEKENIDISINQEKTEDFTELMNNVNSDIQKMQNDIETLNITDSIPVDNDNVDDSFDDFADLIRRRDYKGKVELNEKKPVKKRKLKKWVYVLPLIILAGGFGIYKIIDDRQNKMREREREELVQTIKSHYNKYVKVDVDTDLYSKENDKYKKIGKVYKDAILELEDIDVDDNTKYFAIKDMEYYINPFDVDKTDQIKIDNRYKNYLPFNTNIVTKDSFTIYLDGDKFITINKSMEFPVIINNYNDKYYVEYNNRLVSIKKDDIQSTKESKNTDKKNQSKMTTLAYHRVYDTTDKCTDSYVCLKKEVFDKQMKYLSDNDYFTLTLKEMYMYLKGNLQIEKGVVITFDDGYLYKASDDVLDKYGLNGTMFVISGDFIDKYDQFKDLKAIEIQSHTHKMHKNYVCTGGNQGGKMLCAGKEAIIEDLKISHEALGIEPFGFAYPFYDYNDTIISALQEAGIKMAFIGRAGVMGRSTPKVTNVYKIPRMTVWEESLMSFASWKSYL